MLIEFYNFFFFAFKYAITVSGMKKTTLEELIHIFNKCLLIDVQQSITATKKVKKINSYTKFAIFFIKFFFSNLFFFFTFVLQSAVFLKNLNKKDKKKDTILFVVFVFFFFFWCVDYFIFFLVNKKNSVNLNNTIFC